uniref:V-type proton ATPase subunit G n=1 Tax=Varanus komodoensis TaxID=61221 RepID=A0A8D2JAS9_VARKO
PDASQHSQTGCKRKEGHLLFISTQHPKISDIGKARRLKQAKEEAQAEIEQYRLEREREFQQKQQAALGSQGNLSAEVEAQTRKKLQAMQGGQSRGKDRVLRQLLTLVWDVRPQMHPNYRLAV